MKCHLKTENDYLKTQTKHPLSGATLSLLQEIITPLLKTLNQLCTSQL